LWLELDSPVIFFFFCVYNHVLCEIVNVFKLAILLVCENTNKQLNYSC
jgi:hypothetical protein